MYESLDCEFDDASREIAQTPHHCALEARHDHQSVQILELGKLPHSHPQQSYCA